MVLIEAILCAATLSLCYTATCYDIFECIGSCWCMRHSKYKDSTLHIQAEWTQIQWRRPSLVCCFHEDYHKMTCWWQSHYPNWFPLSHMYSWCQPRLLMLFNAQKTVELPWDQDELHQYQQIHCSGPGQTPFRKMFRTDTFPLPTRMISYQNQLDVHAQQLTALSNDVLACKFDVHNLSIIFTIWMLALVLIL